MNEYEVDMSGKIMVPEENVALALAGPDFEFAVLLTARQKEVLLELIEQAETARILARKKRKKKRKRNAAERGKRVYGILLYYLLSRCPEWVEYVQLDADYDGRTMGQVKTAVHRVLKREGKRNGYLSLVTIELGDGAADRLAKAVYRGNRKADLVLSAEEILFFYAENKKPSFWPG